MELKQFHNIAVAQTGKQFLEDQEMMRDMLQRLEDQRIEIDRLHSRIMISNGHLFKFLDEIEGAFDVNEKFESLEICLDYVNAALYCDRHYGRKNNRIIEAIDWYKNQTI